MIAAQGAEQAIHLVRWRKRVRGSSWNILMFRAGFSPLQVSTLLVQSENCTAAWTVGESGWVVKKLLPRGTKAS
jgi:hypothetical protein